MEPQSPSSRITHKHHNRYLVIIAATSALARYSYGTDRQEKEIEATRHNTTMSLSDYQPVRPLYDFFVVGTVVQLCFSTTATTTTTNNTTHHTLFGVRVPHVYICLFTPQIRATRFLHRLPRFGHSRSIASFVSSDSVEDYQGGVRFAQYFLVSLSHTRMVSMVISMHLTCHMDCR